MILCLLIALPNLKHCQIENLTPIKPYLTLKLHISFTIRHRKMLQIGEFSEICVDYIHEHIFFTKLIPSRKTRQLDASEKYQFYSIVYEGGVHTDYA